MNEKINDGVLYVLKKEQGKIVTDYLSYQNDFKESLDILYVLTVGNRSISSCFEEIKKHIIESDLNNLNGFFKYCENYAGTYQGVKMTNNLEFINQGIDFIEKEIKNREKVLNKIINSKFKKFSENEIWFNLENFHKKYSDLPFSTKEIYEKKEQLICETCFVNPSFELSEGYAAPSRNLITKDFLLTDPPLSTNKKSLNNWLKSCIYERYKFWCKVYSHQKAYEKCKANNQIIASSHRIQGFSFPKYNLNNKFSVILDTNFGYGMSSYFFNKTKYKGIDVFQYSEWVRFRIMKRSEIIRYTRKYYLGGNEEVNNEWVKALDFVKETCNLSLKNEKEFVKEFILKECESLVVNLKKILEDEEYIFKAEYKTNVIYRDEWTPERNHFKSLNYNRNIKFENTFDSYKLNINAQQLIDYKSEKIIGALDFITQIKKLKNIIEVNEFVKKIEDYNKKLLPILKDQISFLIKEANDKKIQLDKVKPIYEKSRIENKIWQDQKEEFRKKNGITDSNLSISFNNAFPKYVKFLEEYSKIGNTYSFYLETLKIINNAKSKILDYNEELINYFSNK